MADGLPAAGVSDEILALRVRQATDALNDAIADARQMGLSVELLKLHGKPGAPTPRDSVTVHVSKAL